MRTKANITERSESATIAQGCPVPRPTLEALSLKPGLYESEFGKGGVGSDSINISFKKTTLIRTDTIHASMTTCSWSSIISGMILWPSIDQFVVSYY